MPIALVDAVVPAVEGLLVALLSEGVVSISEARDGHGTLITTSGLGSRVL